VEGEIPGVELLVQLADELLEQCPPDLESNVRDALSEKSMTLAFPVWRGDIHTGTGGKRRSKL
jgi:hypothetical protein